MGPRQDAVVGPGDHPEADSRPGVDGNVRIDVLTGDPTHVAWSDERLARVRDAGRAAVNPISYAEVSIGGADADALADALPPSRFRRLDLPRESATRAGRAFLAYRRRGGTRTAPLPDFYIGANAQSQGLALLARDPKRYRSDFPDLRLIAPDPAPGC